MFHKKELLVIVLAQVAITLFLTAAQPNPENSGPAYSKVATYVSVFQPNSVQR